MNPYHAKYLKWTFQTKPPFNGNIPKYVLTSANHDKAAQ
jgi:hypothetical protein